MNMNVYDPWADFDEVKREFGIELISEFQNKYNTVVHVVSHTEFLDLDFSQPIETKSVVYDVKGNLPKQIITGRL